jgi:K+:H+ antiporter
MTPGPEYYKELLLFLATAGVIVPLFGRLRLSPVFFLAAGVVLGPFGLGALAKDVTWLSLVSITDVEQIALIAELGIALLLFRIALELSWVGWSTRNRLLLPTPSARHRVDHGTIWCSEASCHSSG